MKRNCLNCHFLSKSHREEDTGRELVFSLSEKERDALKIEPVGFDRGWHSLLCHMGVWDEGLSPLAIIKDETLLSQDRAYSCFFISFRKSMLFKAAIELQKRAEENRQLKASYRMTIIGLWIAGIGLLVNALIAILSAPKC
ncbi:MAG TPA: hypothetical protein VMW10_05040 [Alphaproteobacteria bacterium]|nr:hypothetical protein [Alphaproteobacteria bacterium]